MTVVGCHCSSAEAFFAVIEHPGAVRQDRLSRLALPTGMERVDGVSEFLGQLDAELGRLHPDAVAILRPVYGRRPRPYGPQDATAAFERGETMGLVIAAAARLGIEIRLLSPPKVRGLLGLPREGALEDHIATVFPNPQRPYWAHRRWAALVAEASIR